MKAIKSVEIAGSYRAKEISSIQPKSVDELRKFNTCQNEDGHWVISDETSDYIRAEIDKGSMVILKSPMGTGKTELTIKKEMNRVGRAAHVLPRVSIVDDATKRLNIDHYRNVDEVSAHFTNKIATCVNSLGAARFQAENGVSWFDNLDLLCLDEASQALPQVIQLGKAGRRKKNHDILVNSMRTAKAILVADADANEFLVTELKRLNPERRIVVVDVAHPKSSDKGMDIHFTDSISNARNEFVEAALSGEACLLATDNKRKAVEIEKILLELKPELNIFVAQNVERFLFPHQG